MTVLVPALLGPSSDRGGRPVTANRSAITGVANGVRLFGGPMRLRERDPESQTDIRSLHLRFRVPAFGRPRNDGA